MSPCLLQLWASYMRHSGEQAGCASSVASPHVFCASHLLEVGNGPESRCLGQRCICLHSTFSVLCQGAIHLSCTVTGLVCPLPCNRWQSQLWQLLVLLLLLCLLPLAVILSFPSQMGCSLDMLCVTGMAVTPPQVILFSLISALACTSGQVRIDKDLCVCVC